MQHLQIWRDVVRGRRVPVLVCHAHARLEDLLLVFPLVEHGVGNHDGDANLRGAENERKKSLKYVEAFSVSSSHKIHDNTQFRDRIRVMEKPI